MMHLPAFPSPDALAHLVADDSHLAHDAVGRLGPIDADVLALFELSGTAPKTTSIRAHTSPTVAPKAIPSRLAPR
jgi:hypothetical protein